MSTTGSKRGREDSSSSASSFLEGVPSVSSSSAIPNPGRPLIPSMPLSSMMGPGPLQSSHRTTRCIIENFQAPQGYIRFTPRPGQLRSSEILFGAGLTFDIVEVEWPGAPAANEPMVRIERSRARWKISEYLNQGSFGQVYLMERCHGRSRLPSATGLTTSEITEQRVIKFMLPSKHHQDTKEQDEADKVWSLRDMPEVACNEHIVKFYHVIKSSECLRTVSNMDDKIMLSCFRSAIVMQKIREKELLDLVMESHRRDHERRIVKPFQMTTVRQLAIDMIKAIKCLYDENLTHCDLKPENMRLDERNRVILLDFGMVRVIDPERVLEYIATGSYAYMCPIRRYLYDKKSQGYHITVPPDYNQEKSEAFSIGVILFVLYFKCFPFHISKLHTHREKRDGSQGIADIKTLYNGTFWTEFDKAISSGILKIKCDDSFKQFLSCLWDPSQAKRPTFRDLHSAVAGNRDTLTTFPRLAWLTEGIDEKQFTSDMKEHAGSTSSYGKERQSWFKANDEDGDFDRFVASLKHTIKSTLESNGSDRVVVISSNTEIPISPHLQRLEFLVQLCVMGGGGSSSSMNTEMDLGSSGPSPGMDGVRAVVEGGSTPLGAITIGSWQFTIDKITDYETSDSVNRNQFYGVLQGRVSGTSLEEEEVNDCYRESIAAIDGHAVLWHIGNRDMIKRKAEKEVDKEKSKKRLSIVRKVLTSDLKNKPFYSQEGHEWTKLMRIPDTGGKGEVDMCYCHHYGEGRHSVVKVIIQYDGYNYRKQGIIEDYRLLLAAMKETNGEQRVSRSLTNSKGEVVRSESYPKPWHERQGNEGVGYITDDLGYGKYRFDARRRDGSPVVWSREKKAMDPDEECLVVPVHYVLQRSLYHHMKFICLDLGMWNPLYSTVTDVSSMALREVGGVNLVYVEFNTTIEQYYDIVDRTKMDLEVFKDHMRAGRVHVWTPSVDRSTFVRASHEDLATVEAPLPTEMFYHMGQIVQLLWNRLKSTFDASNDAALYSLFNFKHVENYPEESAKKEKGSSKRGVVKKGDDSDDEGLDGSHSNSKKEKSPSVVNGEAFNNSDLLGHRDEKQFATNAQSLRYLLIRAEILAYILTADPRYMQRRLIEIQNRVISKIEQEDLAGGNRFQAVIQREIESVCRTGALTGGRETVMTCRAQGWLKFMMYVVPDQLRAAAETIREKLGASSPFIPPIIGEIVAKLEEEIMIAAQTDRFDEEVTHSLMKRVRTMDGTESASRSRNSSYNGSRKGSGGFRKGSSNGGGKGSMMKQGGVLLKEGGGDTMVDTEMEPPTGGFEAEEVEVFDDGILRREDTDDEGGDFDMA